MSVRALGEVLCLFAAVESKPGPLVQPSANPDGSGKTLRSNKFGQLRCSLMRRCCTRLSRTTGEVVNEHPSKLHLEPSSVNLLTRARRLLANRGLTDSIAFLCQRFVIPRSRLALSHRVRSAIRKRPGLALGSGTLIVKSTLDYAFPYQQRPHHLAKAFHRQGLKVVFVTPSAGYDRVAIVKEIRPGLLLTPDFEAALTAIDRPIVYTLSTDASLKRALMQAVQRKRGIIIYDYIDAMDSRISSGPLTNSRMELHLTLLREANSCVCVATSLELFQEVTRSRSDGVALVENGVDVKHFAVARCASSLRDDLRQIVFSGGPIAGYFGALAHWLDYDLIMAGASALPHWNFVLIGIDYDGSCRALNGGPKNIHVLPPIPYQDLPRNAIWFDAALIPFKINEITMATSPLKLFEYMALGLPTISTPIQESLRYKSIILARDVQAFVDGIRMARQKRVTDSYQRLLRDEASSNSWDAKASAIIRLLDQARLRYEYALTRFKACEDPVQLRGIRKPKEWGRQNVEELRVAAIVGTRPEAIKMAPVIKALQATPCCECIVIGTAQHRKLLDQVLKTFDLSMDVDLNVMQEGQSLSSLTSRLLERLDRRLCGAYTRPDLGPRGYHDGDGCEHGGILPSSSVWTRRGRAAHWRSSQSISRGA